MYSEALVNVLGGTGAKNLSPQGKNRQTHEFIIFPPEGGRVDNQ